MKKLLLIGGFIVVGLVAVIMLTNQATDAKLKNSPYGDKKISQASIDLIGNKNYKNIVLPDDADKQIAKGETTYVYFFSPTCVHCQEMTPRLMPIADEYQVDVLQYNVLEFQEEGAKYGITGTPSLIRFKDGKEDGRLVGAYPDGFINDFLTDKEIEEPK